jgi:hypothetical protein
MEVSSTVTLHPGGLTQARQPCSPPSPPLTCWAPAGVERHQLCQQVERIVAGTRKLLAQRRGLHCLKLHKRRQLLHTCTGKGWVEVSTHMQRLVHQAVQCMADSTSASGSRNAFVPSHLASCPCWVCRGLQRSCPAGRCHWCQGTRGAATTALHTHSRVCVCGGAAVSSSGNTA